LLKWQYLRSRSFLPMIVIIQVMLGLGIVYGFALLVPHIDSTSALYFATGAPTLGLIILGLTVVPQEVSQGKLTGRYEYVATLPVPAWPRWRPKSAGGSSYSYQARSSRSWLRRSDSTSTCTSGGR
jgi:hypothetical protein